MCLQVYGITTLPMFPFMAVTCSRDTTIRWVLELTEVLLRASGVLIMHQQMVKCTAGIECSSATSAA